MTAKKKKKKKKRVTTAMERSGSIGLIMGNTRMVWPGVRLSLLQSLSFFDEEGVVDSCVLQEYFLYLFFFSPFKKKKHRKDMRQVIRKNPCVKSMRVGKW